MTALPPTLTSYIAQKAFPSPKPIDFTVRGMKIEYEHGVFTLRLPFQRKPVWKEKTKMAYILALFTKGVTDPISLSRRGSCFRCINGGNRIRAIIGFTRNLFPFMIDQHSYWYSSVPENLKTGRKAAFHHAMTDAERNDFDVLTISAVYRDGLTDEQENDLYTAANVNMVPHGPGHILLSHICDSRNEMASKFIKDFPAIKTKIAIDPSPSDVEAFGTRLSTILDVDIDVNNEDDNNEDVLLALALLWNLVLNGKPYEKETHFQGSYVPQKFANHAEQICSVFDGIDVSEEVQAEWKKSATRKNALPEIWNPVYLLGPIAWSIANAKPDAVSTWRKFLVNYRPGLMSEIYDMAVKPNLSSFTMYNADRYKKTWEAVAARMSTASGTA